MKKKNLAVLTAVALVLPVACDVEPATPELHFSLNTSFIEGNNEDLLNDPESLSRLGGALEFIAGSPTSPGYLVLPEWVDDEFDPNYWGLDALSDEDFDALIASNRRAYHQQIAAIEAGDFDAVAYTRYADDLWRAWEELRDAEDRPSNPDAVYRDDMTWRQKALDTFEGYYPTLAESAEMYRQQCYHCHGSEGGGDGSTSPFLNPRPRDYRLGIFKFTGVGKNRPRHGDLFRILEEGIYMTAMPSFRRFTDAQLHGLVDYVRLLAIRGETEVLMVVDYDPDEGFHFDNLKENYQLVVERWLEASEELIAYDGAIPDATPERIEHGRELFLSETGANCAKCHGQGGRGDGPSVVDAKPEDVTDDWGNPILPRDLTRGIFRFGRRPIDLYRRVYAGINGTPMPEHFGMQITEADGTQRPLDEEDVWDLVFFVRSISEGSATVPSGTAEEGL